MNKRQYITSFDATQKKVNQLKKEFFKEAEDFVYFRKGEFDGIVEFLKDFTLDLIDNPEKVIVWYIIYKGAKKIVIDKLRSIKDRKKKNEKLKQFIHKKKKNEVTFRIISVESPRNKKELKEFERKGVGVCRIPEEKRGRIRYLVNEKRFCLFIRQEKNNFFGVEGTDELMIRRLRKLFDLEYTENKI